MVLLIVDAQQRIVTPALYAFELFTGHVARLIARARERGVEVIFIRHDDGEGGALVKGSPGYDICERFRPAPGERVFDKTVNSAFCGTGLLESLRSKGETEVMIAGLQTDYCIDATIKAGFEHGFNMIVPAHANTTFSNAFMTGEASYRYYNECMWPGRYAECIPFEDALARLG